MILASKKQNLNTFRMNPPNLSKSEITKSASALGTYLVLAGRQVVFENKKRRYKMYTQKIHYVHKKYTKCTQNVHKKHIIL